MKTTIIYLGVFPSEVDSEFQLLINILENLDIAYSIIGKNNMYYEGDFYSGIKVCVRKEDYPKIKEAVFQLDNKKLIDIVSFSKESEKRQYNIGFKSFVKILWNGFKLK